MQARPRSVAEWASPLLLARKQPEGAIPHQMTYASADLAFWERIAHDYDTDALAARVPAILERVRRKLEAAPGLDDMQVVLARWDRVAA
jgi:hypothetical protein